MKNIAIIQARTGSTRLPNKVLMELDGKTVLEQVIDRVKKVNNIDEVFVATTIAKKDCSIVNICAKNDIRVFCGSENDVLDRYYQLAKIILPDNIVRITADCPLIDPLIIEKVVRIHEETDSDYTSNVLEETFPDGLDVEVMKFSVLKEAWERADMQSQREHVTQYIIHNDNYKRTNVVSEQWLGDKRWTLDTEEDWLFIQEVYRRLLLEGKDVNTVNILSLLNNEPDIEKLNNNSARNEGLEKSLKEDKKVF